jgi:predicted PurR-regulated permease PerM
LRFLQNLRCPNFLAYLIVIGTVVVLFISVSYFVGKSLNDFIGKIPAYKDRFTEKYSQLETQLEKLGFRIGKLAEPSSGESTASVSERSLATDSTEDKADTTGAKALPLTDADAAADEAKTDEGGFESIAALLLPKSSIEERTLPTVAPEVVEEMVRKHYQESKEDGKPLINLEPQNVMLWIADVFVHLRHFIESSFLVLVFSIFMLFEASQFSTKVEKAFGKDGSLNNKHFHQIAQDIRRYLVLKTIVNCASASAAMLVYYIFGVPAWLFWGIIAFFLYYIPNIGGTLAAVIPGILIFVNYDLPGVFLYVPCLIAIECTIAYGFEPRFLGHGLGLSTVVILLTLVLWGWLLGPIGLFLAAPLTVMVKIILQAFPETKWLAVMLDDARR